MHAIWEDFLTIVREEKGSRLVETWFKAVTLSRWDATTRTVYLEVPNLFVQKWIQSHYITLIQEHLGRLLHVRMPTVVITEKNVSIDTVQDKKPHLLSSVIPDSEEIKRKKIVPAVRRKKDRFFSESYTFDTFVVGSNSSLAYAAAQAVAQKPGVLYNPLFIYGGSGLGKTHLLRAIGNNILLRERHARVLYQTAEHFVSEFISAIRFDKVHLFKEKYHDIDVLLIDDIQFISHKEQTQEAFFHIFNSLYDAHKQLVFSSDVFPHNIQGIADRLSSRLMSGFITDIHAPSTEIKIAILKKKAALHNVILDDEMAHAIASSSRENIRELEGILIRVIAFASLVQKPITMEIVQKILAHDRGVVHKGSIDCDQIIIGVARYFSCSREDLISKTRSKELTFIRHVAIFFMKKLTDKSLRAIGELIGGRDHSTVVHALEKIKKQLEKEPTFYVQLRAIEQAIIEVRNCPV